MGRSGQIGQETGLFAEERRRRILETLDADSRVLVNDLSARFGVSAATLRNDLKELERGGLLRRTHGGAVRVESAIAEHTADVALTEHLSAKVAIGRAAAQLVGDGDTILCDSGSTTFELVRALGGRRGVTVITNDFTIAAEAERTLVDGSIVMLGGTVRRGFHYTIGPETVEALRRLAAPTAFLAASAFSFERGFTVHTLALSLFKQALIERSERHVMLIDSTKLGTYTTARFADLCDMSDLIVDDRISGDDARSIREAEGGPRLVVAE